MKNARFPKFPLPFFFDGTDGKSGRYKANWRETSWIPPPPPPLCHARLAILRKYILIS
jgi:hypothetical protein